MVWAAIGAAAVGVVGGAIVANSGGGGGSSGGGGGNSVGGSSSPAQVADPFASQRPAYQTQLNSLLGSSGTYMGNTTAQAGQSAISSQQVTGQQVAGTSGANSGSAQALSQLNALSQPGNSFTTSDPSYQFRLGQGSTNVARSSAATGLVGSGNILAALDSYGQNMASTEYAAQYSRDQQNVASNLSAENQQYNQNLVSENQQFNQNLSGQQQQFSQFGSIDQNAQNIYQNNYSRLAQLSGANVGSPSAAGGLLASQQAGSAAQVQNWAGLAVQGAQALSGGSASTPAPYLGGVTAGAPVADVTAQTDLPTSVSDFSW